MDLVFQASQFKAVGSYTAKDKADFANQLVRFVQHDFKRTLLTKKLYERLSMSFGHIAHFSQDGFYDTFFATLEGKVKFLYQIVTAACYDDVELAVREWVRQQRLTEKYQHLRDEEFERAERFTLERLKARYEPDLYPELRALVRGCHDYSGGNRSNAAALAAFHNGIDTVTRVVDAWIEAKRSGKSDTQINAVLAVGRDALKKEGGK